MYPDGRAGDEERGVDLVRPFLHLLVGAVQVAVRDQVEQLKNEKKADLDGVEVSAQSSPA